MVSIPKHVNCYVIGITIPKSHLQTTLVLYVIGRDPFKKVVLIHKYMNCYFIAMIIIKSHFHPTVSYAIVCDPYMIALS